MSAVIEANAESGPPFVRPQNWAATRGKSSQTKQAPHIILRGPSNQPANSVQLSSGYYCCYFPSTSLSSHFEGCSFPSLSVSLTQCWVEEVGVESELPAARGATVSAIKIAREARKRIHRFSFSDKERVMDRVIEPVCVQSSYRQAAAGVPVPREVARAVLRAALSPSCSSIWSTLQGPPPAAAR